MPKFAYMVASSGRTRVRWVRRLSPFSPWVLSSGLSEGLRFLFLRGLRVRSLLVSLLLVLETCLRSSPSRLSLRGRSMLVFRLPPLESLSLRGLSLRSNRSRSLRPPRVSRLSLESRLSLRYPPSWRPSVRTGRDWREPSLEPPRVGRLVLPPSLRELVGLVDPEQS